MPRKHDDSGFLGKAPHEVSRNTVRDWYRYLARDPPSYDSGIPLSEADAKTMMDKIEARSKWLKANGKARKFQEADQECSLATFPECDEPVASDKKCPRGWKTWCVFHGKCWGCDVPVLPLTPKHMYGIAAMFTSCLLYTSPSPRDS